MSSLEGEQSSLEQEAELLNESLQRPQTTTQHKWMGLGPCVSLALSKRTILLVHCGKKVLFLCSGKRQAAILCTLRISNKRPLIKIR